MSGAGPAPPPGFCMADRATELDDIESSLRDLVIECEVTGRRTLFARGGRGVAILASYDEWVAMKDTIDVLGDPAVMRDLEVAEDELKRNAMIAAGELP